MNITKIKRILAKYGIGNPLNQLFFTSQEIKEMNNLSHEIDIAYRSGHKAGYTLGIKKSEEIISSRTGVRLERVCELWCEWNRKELDASDFALKFGALFKKETMIKWREYLKK